MTAMEFNKIMAAMNKAQTPPAVAQRIVAELNVYFREELGEMQLAVVGDTVSLEAEQSTPTMQL